MPFPFYPTRLQAPVPRTGVGGGQRQTDKQADNLNPGTSWAEGTKRVLATRNCRFGPFLWSRRAVSRSSVLIPRANSRLFLQSPPTPFLGTRKAGIFVCNHIFRTYCYQQVPGALHPSVPLTAEKFWTKLWGL